MAKRKETRMNVVWAAQSVFRYEGQEYRLGDPMMVDLATYRAYARSMQVIEEPEEEPLAEEPEEPVTDD